MGQELRLFEVSLNISLKILTKNLSIYACIILSI
jgi:hypothetical protein